jgi:hypothetical protein
VKEYKDLSSAGIDSLTDILYNVGYTPVKGEIMGSTGPSCYEPQNAILFYDAKGKVTNYIELCFHCHRYLYSSSQTRAIDYCSQKFDMLKRYFSYQGINFDMQVRSESD